MVLLILKLIFVDRDVLSIILSGSFLGFYLITFINYFRKKEKRGNIFLEKRKFY